MSKKPFINSLILNKSRIKILTMMMVLSIVSSKNFIELSNKEQNSISMEQLIEQDQIESNNQLIEYCKNNSILAGDFKSTIKKDYYIQNNSLKDKNGNTISLKNTTKDTYIFDYNLSEEILKNIDLKNSKITTLGLNGSAVGNYLVNYLPKSLDTLSLKNCAYITDLNELPNKCPNIEYLDLNKMPSLTDYSFIYKLPNLKEVYIAESAFITQDLLNYLDEKNIKTNIGIIDLAISIKLDEIIKTIIKPNMNDMQKINAITNYVINNMNYDINKHMESNNTPLSQALMEKNGVCVSYAYLTNALLKKANINSYKIINDNHAWNLVDLDGKYYYIDPTNINTKEVYQFILKNLNIGKNYMVDPDSSSKTLMTSPKDNQTNIPIELIDDIIKGEDKKNLIEKYGADIINNLYVVASHIALIITYLGIIPITSTTILTVDTIKRIKDDYENEKEKMIIKIMED